MKDIHPQLTKTKFACATCGASFEIETTMNADTFGIDICSKCHPFYIGKSTSKALSGRSEKLESKFAAGKANLSSPKKDKVSKEKKSKNGIKDLSSL